MAGHPHSRSGTRALALLRRARLRLELAVGLIGLGVNLAAARLLHAARDGPNAREAE